MQRLGDALEQCRNVAAEASVKVGGRGHQLHVLSGSEHLQRLSRRSAQIERGARCSHPPGARLGEVGAALPDRLAQRPSGPDMGGEYLGDQRQLGFEPACNPSGPRTRAITPGTASPGRASAFLEHAPVTTRRGRPYRHRPGRSPRQRRRIDGRHRRGQRGRSRQWRCARAREQPHAAAPAPPSAPSSRSAATPARAIPRGPW